MDQPRKYNYKWRTGRPSKVEIAFVLDNRQTMSLDDISTHLNRAPSWVSEIAKEMEGNLDDEWADDDRTLIYSLRNKPFWRDVKKQFDEHERDLYQYHWVSYNNQLGTDVTHAEESQICRVIELEIMTVRLLNEKASLLNKLKPMEQRYREELAKEQDDQDVNLLSQLNSEISALRSAESYRSTEYDKLSERQSKILRELKATRDQRLKEIESKKQNFVDWLKQFADPSFRHKVSKEMELDRMAMNKEHKRLSDYHTYADNTIDQPLLNGDVVKEDNQQ